MTFRYDVTAVGMINFDINVKYFDVDKLNIKVQEVDQIELGFGGDAQNCSSTLSRLGLKVALCGAVGKDIAGNLCVERAAGLVIDTSMICRKDIQTGTAIQLFETAEANVLDCSGANSTFCLEDIPSELFGSSKVISLHSFYGCGRIGAEFLKKAQMSGSLTVADTTSLQPEDTIDEISDALKYLDYFVPSYPEASQLSGEADPERICRVFENYSVKKTVLKMGEKGCYVSCPEFHGFVPGFKVDEVVDTTGCGDNFVAGFIAGIVKGFNIVASCRLANAAGAINATRLGSNGAVTSYEQLINFIKEREV